MDSTRFSACSTDTRGRGRYLYRSLPDAECFDRKRTCKTSVLSNYLSQHALVLRGADTISNARIGEFSTYFSTD